MSSFGRVKIGSIIQKSIPPVCFTKGAVVKTDQGKIKIENITNENTIDGYKVIDVVTTTNTDKNIIFIKKNSLGKKIPNKNEAIVVYCSLGIRSETIGETLKASGYTNIKNLYGGIFEWKNKNFKVYNNKQIETDSIHAFSKTWSKWLKNGIKYYPKTVNNE